MSIKGIARNLKNKGLKGTLDIYKKRKQAGLSGTGQEMAGSGRTPYEELFDTMRIISDAQLLIYPHISDASPVIRKYNAACIMHLLYSSYALRNEEKLPLIDEIISEIKDTEIGEVTEEKLASWDSRMLSLETGKYRKFLKRLFVGGLMPELYQRL